MKAYVEKLDVCSIIFLREIREKWKEKGTETKSQNARTEETSFQIEKRNQMLGD